MFSIDPSWEDKITVRRSSRPTLRQKNVSSDQIPRRPRSSPAKFNQLSRPSVIVRHSTEIPGVQKIKRTRSEASLSTTITSISGIQSINLNEAASLSSYLEDEIYNGAEQNVEPLNPEDLFSNNANEYQDGDSQDLFDLCFGLAVPDGATALPVPRPITTSVLPSAETIQEEEREENRENLRGLARLCSPELRRPPVKKQRK